MKNLLPKLRFTLFLFMLLGIIQIAAAYDFVSGGIYYKITSSTNMTVEVTYLNKTNNAYSGTVTIPEKVTHDSKTYYVTAIGEYAFVGCTGLKGVNFASERTTSIGNYAFQGCNGLTSFVIPPHITSIGNYVFNACYGVTGIVIEESEETLSFGYGCSKGQTYGLFNDCPLYSVFIGRPLSYNTSSNYGYSPFAKLTTLVKARLGNHLPNIYNYLFYGCTSLATMEYNSQFKPTSVGSYAFSGCKAMTWDALNLPQSVKTIGSYAFSNCTKFTSLVIKPHITTINDYAFYGCTAVTGVTIEESEETLSLGYGCSKGQTYGLFNDCPLYSVFIGRPLSYNTSSNYGYSPFAKLTTLEKARLGKKLTLVPNYLFYGCTHLNEVTCCAVTPPTANTNCFANYDATLYVPKGSVSAYKNAAVWKDFYSIIGVDIVDSLPGDVDGNDKVNITDVTSLIDYLLAGNTSVINTTNADVNGDGRINITDVTDLIDYLLSGQWN